MIKLVSLSSPRVSSTIAVIILTVYMALVADEREEILSPNITLIFLLSVGTLIAIAAFNFAGNEIKRTEGVLSVFDLSFKKIIGIITFAAFIAIGYNTLVLILIEFFSVESFSYSRVFVTAIVAFLIIYPFFQYRFLALPGEDSSIPAEYVIEKVLEFIAEYIKSPFLVAVIAYVVTYIIPMFVLMVVLDINILLSIILIATILPLISLGALAGAGIGEDLIRLRLIRHPFKDLKKLGLPKINIRQLKFEVGGLFLVIFAIQAIITTTIFGILSIMGAAGILDRTTVAFTTFTLFVTLFNKGRGATKEMKEVWTEGGFKVNIFQLFLPVYVFLGVIMSSALEIFVGRDVDSGVLADIGLGDHTVLTIIVLAIQNFIMIFTAILIFRKPPGTAERRLIKEVPQFYGDDNTGYMFIYRKLKSDRSIENLLLEIDKIIRKDIKQTEFYVPIIQESLTTGSERVQIAASRVVFTITKKMKIYNEDIFNLVNLSLDSLHVGSRIYGVRAMRNILSYLEGQQKEEAITKFSKKIQDTDPVVSWDTSLALQSILNKEPEYRGFILALMIKNLISTTHEGALNAITRFLNKAARESDDVGRMAMNILGIQLSSGKSVNINNILSGIKALLRGNSFLATDLLQTIEIGIESPDVETRRDYYLVLSNLAEYGSGQEDEILQFIMRGVTDEEIEIQKIAFDALSKDVVNNPNLINDIFEFFFDNFSKLDPEAKVGAMNVLEAIAKEDEEKHQQIFHLLKTSVSIDEDEIKAMSLSIMSIIVAKTPSLSEDIYHISEQYITHKNPEIRVKAIQAIGRAVQHNSSLAKAVHRKIINARNDPDLRIQIVAIEALGFVASSNRQLSRSIYQELTPLLKDEDWQVRIATLNGLFAATKSQKEFYPEFTQAVAETLSDPDLTVRMAGLDFLNFLIEKYRPTAEIMMKTIKTEFKDKTTPNEVKATLFNALQIIATYKRMLASSIISLMHQETDNESSEVRIALLGALSATLERITKSRELGGNVQKELNKLITKTMKAANHSNPAIRKHSYELITNICKAFPTLKIAKRGRNAIDTAIKHEKDVGLQEFLDICRVRAKPPMDFDY